MTPNEGQQLAIESRDRELPDNHWNRVYTDPDYFGEFAKRPAIQTGASLSPFPETYAKRQANIAYLSSSLEIPAEEMPAIYEAKKNEIGKTALQTPTLSDEGLFNYFKKQFDRENEVNTAADGIYQEVQKSVFQGLFDSQAGTDITGQPAYRPLLEQKLTEAGEILSDEDRLRIRENADKMADNLRRANDSIGDEARWLFDIVSKQTGRGQEYELAGEQPNPAGTVGGLGPVMNLAVKQPEAAPAGEVDLNDPEMLNFQTEQILEKFADMPTERRQSIYLLAGAFAELNQVDKGIFYQAAETLGRFLTREMGERISRNFTEESIRGQQRLLQGDLPLYEATNLDGSKGLSQAPTSGQAPITAEQREKLKTDAARKLKILQIKRELVNLADTQIDPIKVVTDWPTWEQGFYGFVGSIPYAGIAAIPFVGFPAITASFFGQYKDDLLLEYPDMDPDQAAAISALAAPMAAGLELIQANLVMGRFVSLDRAIKFFLKPSRNPMTRIIARGTATFGLETGIELSQNRVLPILQTLGAALSDDIPDYDWRKDIEAFDEELGVTAVTMLLFTLTGLPFITSQEIGRNAAYLQDKKMLKYFGMSEEQADRVSTALTKKERVAAFKEAEAARDPALIEAGRRQLFVDTMAQLQEPADPFQPSIRRDGDRFTVLDAEGNTIADRVDVDTAFYEFERIAGSSETLFASVQGELINALLEAGQATNPEGFSEQIEVATQEVINRYNNMTPEQLQRRIAQWERETGQTWQPGAAVNITAVNTLEQVKEGLFQSITRVVKAKSPEEIRAVLEDRAEGQYKMALQSGQFSEADMVGWIREYESGTGDSLLEEDFTSRDVVEAVSTMSVAYYSGNLDNARVSSRLRAFFEALKEYFAAIFARGIRIKEAIAAGQIAPEFEAFLAQSVGLDIDRQIGVQAAQQARAEVNGRTEPLRATALDPNAPTVMLPDGSTVVGPTTFAIKVWHGSRAEFDKFETSKILTGEGAVVYGWGLYFAQKRDVAEEYRIKLAYNPDEQKINGRQINEEYKSIEQQAMRDGSEWKYSVLDGLERLMLHETVEDVISYGRENNWDDRALEYFQRANYQTFGNMYEVSLDVSKNSMLDWDSPLSAQSARVKKAIDALLQNETDTSGIEKATTGEGIYSWFEAGVIQRNGEQDPSTWFKSTSEAKKEVSTAMVAQGIKGIRYLDQGSRNRYEIKWKKYDGDRIPKAGWRTKIGNQAFPEDDLHAYIYPVNTGYAVYVEELGNGEINDVAMGFHATLEEAKAEVEAAFGPTYNYVIFDEGLVEILTRNGQPVATPESTFAISPEKGMADLNKLPEGITTFSGGGLVEIGLAGLVTPTLAVEYSPAIAQAYRAAHGDHVKEADIRTVSLEEHRGKFHYHASPVCKNSSLLKSAAKGGGEQDLDIESAQAVARHIEEVQSSVVTIENVPEYRKTEAADIIRRALDEQGYTFDEAVYNAAEYGAPTARRRYLLRAIKGNVLLAPPMPVKGPGWFATVADIIETLPDDSIAKAKYIYRSMREQGVDPDNVTEPLLVSGTTLFKKVAFARPDQPAFTFKATPATIDRILLPGGRVKRVTARAKARMTGIPDSYPLPADERTALTIIGNGVPPALVRNVFGPVIMQAREMEQGTFSINPYPDREQDPGAPLTETEIREQVEGEPGLTADIEVDPAVWETLDDKQGQTFSIRPGAPTEGNIPQLLYKQLKGKNVFFYFADRMRVGEYTGLDPASGIKIALQGGPGYPFTLGNIDSDAGWAFTDDGSVFSTFANRVKGTDGIGIVCLYTEGNIRGNKTFLKAYMAEVAWAVKSGKLTKDEWLAEANRIRQATLGKAKRDGTTIGDGRAAWIPLWKKEWTTLNQAEQALEASTYDIRGGSFFGFEPTKVGQKGSIIGATKLVEKGFPNIDEMIKAMEDPRFAGLQYGDMVSAVQFDKADTKPYRAGDLNVKQHDSYDVIIKGKGLGMFDKPKSVLTVIKTDKPRAAALRALSMSMAQTTFAISPASYYGDLESAVAALNSNPAFRRERVAAVLSKFKRIKEQFANKADLEPLSMPEAVAQLEAIITLLPPDAQSEIGGFRRLLSFATAKGRLNYLTDRIAKADAALEKYLRTELQEDIMDLLERAMPKPGENKVQTSSLGPDAQRVANLAIAAIELGTDETSNTMAEIEAALASPDITPDRQEQLLEQWGVLNALGDFFNRSALELDQARVFLRQTFGAGRAMWRMQQEARRKQYRDMAEELAGGLKKATENQIDKMDKENPWLKNPRQFVLSHYSFMQLLRSVLPKAGFLETWERSIRQAEIGSSRYRMDAAKRFIDTLMAASGKKTSFGVGRLMYDMRKTRKAAVRYKEGYNEKLIRLPMETAANILEGRASAKAFGLNAAGVAKMSEAYLAVPIMRRRTTPSGAVRETPNRQQFLEFYVRQSEGTDDKLNMSPAEAMQLLLAWDQSEVQARMRRQGWTDESIEDMQKMVTSVPGGEATMDFLRREYKAGGDAADPVYMKMFGMAMPRIENYAPTRYRHKDDSNDLSPMGSALELAGTTPGSLKARQRHDARMRRTDAITVFFQHAAQMGHWIHFAEINREIRGVLKNQNVRESMEATMGRSGLQIFDQWMDTLAQGGGRRAMELSADKDIWAALISGKSIASLGFSVRTLFMQIDAANRAALDMGLAEYTKTVLDPRWMADMPKAWNSDTVQRRLIEGSRPEVRYVFERAAVRPSMLLWAAQKSMIPMQMTDAALTSFTAAIVYRNAYNKAKKAQASDAMAEQAALDAMDKAVFNYSQPIDITSRSLREVQGNMLQKVYMMFLSDARLKTALFAEAIGQLGKEGERGKGASTISALMIMAVVTQTMANLYRDWFSDEPDDEIWTLEGYAMAMMLAPLSGYMLVGTVGSTVVREAFGEMTFQSTDPANEMIDRGIRSIKGWDNTFNTSDPEAMLKQWNNLLRFASFNPTLAAPAALLNFAKPIVGAMENAENPE
jgi:site-specific DNA-cytosine methylase